MKNIYLTMLLMVFLMVLAMPSNAQIIVTGKVISLEDSTGLVGVNVVEKNTTNGVVTDIDGNFTLTCVSDDPILSFSSVGFTFQEFDVKSHLPKDLRNQIQQAVKEEEEHVIIYLVPEIILEEQVIICFLNGPCNFFKVGYNGGVHYNHVGVRLTHMTPFIFALPLYLGNDITFRIQDRHTSYLDISLVKYNIPLPGPLEASVMGNYRRISFPGMIIKQRALAPVLIYRRFEVMAGYMDQTTLDVENKTFDRGFVLGLKKDVLWHLDVGVTAMKVMGEWQYGFEISEDIPYWPVTIALRHQVMGDYKEFDISLLYRIIRISD